MLSKLDAYTILVMLIVTNVIAIFWALYRTLFENKNDYHDMIIAGALILVSLLLLKINERLEKVK